MSAYWWVVPVILAVIAIVFAVVSYPRMRHRRKESALLRARHVFQLRREWLEAKFVTLASNSGSPRGLTWVNCDFENPVSFARDRTTGELRALVGVNISFSATPGSGMEDNPNVGNVRAATAVFRLDGTEWVTDGRAVFNLNPAQTIQHFQHELELVE